MYRAYCVSICARCVAQVPRSLCTVPPARRHDRRILRHFTNAEMLMPQMQSAQFRVSRPHDLGWSQTWTQTDMVRSFYTDNSSSPAFDSLLVVCPSNIHFHSRGKYAARNSTSLLAIIIRPPSRLSCDEKRKAVEPVRTAS